MSVNVQTDRQSPPLARQPGEVAAYLPGLLRRNLDVLVEPGSVVELRSLDVEYQGRKLRSLSGYYNNVEAMARDAAMLDGNARGIYLTLNPVRPELLARSPNKLTLGIACTTDRDIVRRRWVLVDLDPARPKDVNASEDEVSESVKRAEAVWLEGRRLGWGEPVAALSGNGSHLLFACDLPTEDDGLVRDFLRKLDAMFSDERVRLDPSVSNASRIVRLYGTTAAKAVHSEERPQRRSVLLAKDRPW